MGHGSGNKVGDEQEGGSGASWDRPCTGLEFGDCPEPLFRIEGFRAVLATEHIKREERKKPSSGHPHCEPGPSV